MNVYVTSPGENWILDRISQEFLTHKPDISTNNLQDADILWLLDGYSWRNLSLEFLKSKKIVLSVHHVTPKKFNLQEFSIRDQIVDLYHVPCQQTYNFIRQFTLKPIEIVGYWYNSDLWKPLNKDKCRENLGLDKDKFIVGSFQRDTEGHDLKTPKLEKGPDLLCDYLQKIKDAGKDLHVLLGGWRRQYVISKLEELDIEYTYREMAPLEEIHKMYGACDLYIVSSRYEGGPQAILEASSMKVPIISTKVGMAADILTENCLVDIKNDMYFPTKEDADKNFENVIEYEIHNQLEKYEKMFRGIK